MTASKPAKPSPTFPLFSHGSGKWAKKIKGRILYFGRWDDPEGALREYEEFQRRLAAAPSEEPSPGAQLFPGALTVGDACNLFLATKAADVAAGHLASRSLADYKRTAMRLIEFWGRERAFSTIGPNDYTRYRAWFMENNNPITCGNEITRAKTMLKWLKSSGYIDTYDVGPDFHKPSAKVMRKQRRLSGKKLFLPDQVRAMLVESGIHMRAMILLGINCGFGNNDCNELPLAVVQGALSTGWMEYHRPKTEVDRRCPLWPETRDALALSLQHRPKSPLPNAFLKANGTSFSMVNCDVAKRFQIARRCCYVTRGGFYWLRHTFATTAGSCGDQVAVNFIMGHVDPTMAATYREEVGDDRLQLAADTVRRWLWPAS